MSNDTKLNDHRLVFKGSTLSNYKLTDVKKQFMNEMVKGNIEPACYWSAEMVCSGFYQELWECIIFVASKYIHISNPKIINYLENRYETFRNIMIQKHYNFEIELRNNDTIRTMFAEISTVLSLSPKRLCFEPLKIDKAEEFDMSVIKDKLKAPTTTYAEEIFDKEDPKELFIAINELAYHLSVSKPNFQDACYWIEWIIEFEVICRKRKQKIKCKRRIVPVENKFQMDCIWLIWEILILYNTKKNKNTESIMNSLRNLFCIKYGLGTAKKRKHILYFALELITENVDTNIEIISKKDTVKKVIEKINAIYKQIKKNEIAPKTDYLFKDVKENHLENSLKKMNMLENMDFIPRDND